MKNNKPSFRQLWIVALVIMLPGLCYGKQKSKRILTSGYPMTELRTIVPAPMTFRPVPQAKDAFWKETIPETARNSYIALGKQYQGQKWTDIPATLFAEYKRNGNRFNYEKESFGQRRKLACLVMAEIMDHQGAFIPDIIAGLKYFIRETWWGVPAHYPAAAPNPKNQVVDLFNAETGGLVAWTIYMLHDELEAAERGITTQMRGEIQRRILTPSLTTDFGWKRNTSNWNPWICSNWLTCVLFCENDRNWQLDAIRQILTSLDIFIDGNPDDGGCDEGIHYWDRAAASLFENLNLLQIATNGQLSVAHHPKIEAMGSFLYKMYIGKSQFANFADSYASPTLHINIVYPFGKYLNDSLMMAYAAKIARDRQFRRQPAALYQESGNYPTLGRELLFLMHYQDFIKQQASEPLLLSSWLPDLQVLTAHSEASASKGLYLAAKGGHNDESHNHNDIGNFIVYKNGEPIIVDIGVGTYTAKTFSNRRYELFNCRSAYHNVPLINGREQHEGLEYKAKKVEYQSDGQQEQLSMDLSGAYPSEAAVKKWKRTICLRRGQDVQVTEDYQLRKYRHPSEIDLICAGKPQLQDDGTILLGSGKEKCLLRFDQEQLSPDIEKVTHQDQAISNAWKKRPLYRIRLIIKSQALKGEITYTIE